MCSAKNRRKPHDLNFSFSVFQRFSFLRWLAHRRNPARHRVELFAQAEHGEAGGVGKFQGGGVVAEGIVSPLRRFIHARQG